MANSYTNQNRYGRDVILCMRRANSLEADWRARVYADDAASFAAKCTLVGSASIVGDEVRMYSGANGAAGMWLTDAWTLDSPWSLMVHGRYANSGLLGWGDGLALVCQNNGLGSYGGTGGYMAYNFANCLAFEFDYFQNTTFTDLAATVTVPHAKAMSRGASQNSPDHSIAEITEDSDLPWGVFPGSPVLNGFNFGAGFNGSNMVSSWAASKHKFVGAPDDYVTLTNSKGFLGVTSASGAAYPGDVFIDKVAVYSPNAQTEFHWYTATTKTSLGTPDGGVSVPAENALYTNDADLATQHITDVRDAIEAMVAWGAFVNPSTGNPYNWDNADADNLHYVALGSGYDWARNTAAMVGDHPRDIDVYELDRCLAYLEAADDLT